MTTPTIDTRDAERTAELLSTHNTGTGNLARAFRQLQGEFKIAFQAGLDLQRELDDVTARVVELEDAQAKILGQDT